MEVGLGVTSAHVILCLNSGSSSRKFALYRIGDQAEALIVEGAAERVGLKQGQLWIRDAQRKILLDARRDFPHPAAAVQAIFAELERLKLPNSEAVGHRLVHGGPNHVKPQRVTAQLIAALKKAVAFAPLHLPAEIAGIEAVASRCPALPQVACFDTAFHREMPEVAERFALPRVLWDEGIRRWGFHGLSYEYIMQTLGSAAPRRIVIAHLGNGASMAAIADGRPMDTTMGFTPAGGFMMGTRSGDLDPGIILYLINRRGYDANRLDRLVNHESGLLGVSALSSDMKTLLDRRDSDRRATLAVEMFCYQARKQIGAFAAALGGLELLVFTGGIGERAAAIREEVCRGLEHLGIRLDSRRNEQHADTISADDGGCTVRVIPANEDLMIARHTTRLLSRSGAF